MTIPVSTPADLDNVRNNLGAHYVQTQHIDMAGVSWTPIGAWDDPFIGTYDGQCFEIRNLTLSGAGPLGLFREVHNTGVLKNMTIRDGSITITSGTGTCGLLVIYVEGEKEEPTIYNCYVINGTVVGSYNSGLMIGSIGQHYRHTVIEKCAATGQISSTATSCRITGFIGTIHTAVSNVVHIKNCYARANLTVPSNNGECGTFGPGTRISSSAHFENCYSAGTVTGAGATHLLTAICREGGLFIPTATNCYYDHSIYPYQREEELGIPRSTADMTYPENFGNTYQGWDFTEVWRHDPSYTINAGYPWFTCAVKEFRVWVKKQGIWESVPSLPPRKSGEWKDMVSASVRKSGDWKQV